MKGEHEQGLGSQPLPAGQNLKSNIDKDSSPNAMTLPAKEEPSVVHSSFANDLAMRVEHQNSIWRPSLEGRDALRTKSISPRSEALTQQLQLQQEMFAQQMAEQTRKYEEMMSAEQAARRLVEADRDRVAEQAMLDAERINQRIFSAAPIAPPDNVPEMTVYIIHAVTNSQKNISIHERDSIEVLRHKIDQIITVQQLGWTTDYELHFNGQTLVSSKFLISYGIEDGDVIRLAPKAQVEHFAMNSSVGSFMSPSPSKAVEPARERVGLEDAGHDPVSDKTDDLITLLCIVRTRDSSDDGSPQLVDMSKNHIQISFDIRRDAMVHQLQYAITDGLNKLPRFDGYSTEYFDVWKLHQT